MTPSHTCPFDCVSDAMDSIDDRVKAFFKKCQGCQNLKQEWKDEQFQKLKEVRNRPSCF